MSAISGLNHDYFVFKLNDITYEKQSTNVCSFI